jgi:5-methylcytosine-specific restriction endonuclease McrA
MTWTAEDSQRLYNSPEWKKFRKDYQANFGGEECLHCGGHISKGTFNYTLHHNPALTLTGGTNAFDVESIEEVCRSCNSKAGNRAMIRTNYSNPKLVSL